MHLQWSNLFCAIIFAWLYLSYTKHFRCQEIFSRINPNTHLNFSLWQSLRKSFLSLLLSNFQGSRVERQFVQVHSEMFRVYEEQGVFKTVNFHTFNFLWLQIEEPNWAGAQQQNQENELCAQRRLRSARASARPVWSESLLCAWRRFESLATH